MSSKRPASAARRRDSWHPTTTEHRHHSEAAHERDQKRGGHEEIECGQFMKLKLKLVAKPTNAYANVRLIHRQDDAKRKQSLHRNDSGNIRVSSTPVRPHTARETSATQPAARDRRPHTEISRKGERVNLVTGQHINVSFLERTNYHNPTPRMTHLAASQSAPRLQATMKNSAPARHTASEPSFNEASHGGRSLSQVSSASGPTLFTEEKEDTSGRRHIVVHMQRMVVTDDDELDVEPTIEVSLRERARQINPAGPKDSSSRSSRVGVDNSNGFKAQRRAWQE